MDNNLHKEEGWLTKAARRLRQSRPSGGRWKQPVVLVARYEYPIFLATLQLQRETDCTYIQTRRECSPCKLKWTDSNVSSFVSNRSPIAATSLAIKHISFNPDLGIVTSIAMGVGRKKTLLWRPKIAQKQWPLWNGPFFHDNHGKQSR